MNSNIVLQFNAISDFINSKKNPELARGLLISIPVVVGISMLIYLIIWLWTRQLRKKALVANIDEKDIPIVNEIAQKFNKLDARIVSCFKNSYHLNDLKWIASTIKINDFKKVLLLGKDLETPLLILQEVLKMEINILKKNIDVKKWNQQVLQKPELFTQAVKTIEQVEQDYDLIINLSTFDNYRDYQDYYPKLKEKGMLMIKQSLIFDKNNLKFLQKELITKNIKHEVSFAHSKFLYIIK
ncbi:BC85_0335 family putative methyltransferase [Mycoplasmopsis hyopharyngis]|uniref:BC85_0335 family putative methyltransferase n=1 Tax=Mycoplasmopsis hyopharyngis TaxID=29558 RepID=UPI00387392D8